VSYILRKTHGMAAYVRFVPFDSATWLLAIASRLCSGVELTGKLWFCLLLPWQPLLDGVHQALCSVTWWWMLES